MLRGILCALLRGRAARAAIAAAIGLAIPSLAGARTEVLQWTHPSMGSVVGYKVHWGTASGSYGTTISVGAVPISASGVMSYSLTVPDDATVYVAVTAYNSSNVESAYSNERVRVPPQPPASGGGGGSTLPPPDPDPNAQASWSENFQGVGVGTQVNGWVDTQPWSSLSVDDALFSVVDVQSDRLLTTSSSAVDIHSHWISSQSPGWSSYEVRGLMLVSSASARIGITANSKFVNAPVLYRLSSHWTTRELELHGAPWDTATKSCPSKGTGVVPQANTWYRYRFQVVPQQGSNLIRAKVWPHGSTEPSSWQAECSDLSASRPTSGTVGVWSGGGGGALYWDDFEVIPVESASGGSGGSGPAALGAPGQPFLITQ